MAQNNQMAAIGVSNMPAFQDAMRQYLAQTKRELSEALNQTLFYIARGASRHTPKADRAAYEKELGVKAYQAMTYKRGDRKGQARVNKKGQIRFQRKMDEGATLANLIVNARLGRAGKPGLYGSAMKSATNKLFGKRARSVGTLKAGWLGAIRALARSVGQARGGGVDGASNRVEGRSRAIPARPGWNPQASLEYLVNSFTREHQPYIDARVKEALRKAFEDETRSKLDHLAKKMAKTAEKAHRATSKQDVMRALIGVVPELAGNTGGHGAGRVAMRGGRR